MIPHRVMGTDRSQTSSGRRALLRLRPQSLVLLLPGVIALACAKPNQIAPEAGTLPQLIWSPPLAYPPAMFQDGVEGRVVVQAMVDSTGRVEANSIEVVSASHYEFRRPAVDMIRNSRFEPGRSGDRALRTQIRVPVVFDLKRASTVGSADSLAAADLASEGEMLARRGNINDALTAYSAAQALDARLNGQLGFWYGLCWHGALWGYAEDVMFACEQAVALEPGLASTREARGLARALTDDYAGAIQDLEEAAARAFTPEERLERLRWIGVLRSGENPFTESVIEALRQRTS